jgi:predicted ATPase/DNA-binding CsgD family transcriptional regulator
MVINTLPRQPTVFIGRERELADLIALMDNPDCRLLTLVGPGGIGKTRLAIKVAEMLDGFRNGVYFIDLSTLRESELVAKTIAQALNIGEIAAEEHLETLKRVLKKREMLLVLDNFEQLIDAVAVVSELLQATSKLKIIVTSRESLRLNGEQEYLVPPLCLPPSDSTFECVAKSEAVALFVARAQMVSPYFKLTDDNRHELGGICRQLDGLPLAIELAAVRCKMLSPLSILEQLGNRLDLLMGGPRDVPTRHQTLRNTIDWSYELLSQNDKILFRRLAVFSGGCSLEAIQAVCGINSSMNILDGLTSLVNKSLLYPVHNVLGEIRFVMLKTIHDYACERLEASGETNLIFQSMADYHLEMAQRAEAELRRADQQTWFKRLEIEHENIRVVLNWCINQHCPELAMQLMTALRDFWFYQGFHTEALQWLERLLVYMGNTPPVLRARVLLLQGLLAYARQKEAQSFHEEALQIFHQTGDRHNTAWALTFLAFVSEGEPGGYADAIGFCEVGLALFRQFDDLPGVAWALNVMGNLKRLNGDCLAAKSIYEDCLKICRLTGERRRIAMVLGNLGIIAERMRQYEQAKSLIQESILLACEIDYKYTIPAKLSLMAGVFAGQGHMNRAAHLLSASLAINETLGIVAQANTQVEIDRYTSNLRTQLGEEVFNTYWREGQKMSLERAVQYVLEEAIPQSVSDQNQMLVDSLSLREMEVLQLIAEGYNNREIAAHLYISINTIKKHINHLFGKLDAKTRTEALARARHLRLLP